MHPCLKRQTKVSEVYLTFRIILLYIAQGVPTSYAKYLARCQALYFQAHMSRCHHILCRHIRLPRLMYKEVGLGAPCKGSNLWNFPPPGHNHPCPYHAQCSMFKAAHCNAPSHNHHCPHQGSALCHVARCGTVVLCGSDNHWLSERNQRAKHSSQRMLISSLLQL